MGVLNVTPDSFSDGGRYAGPGDAVGRALAMVREGADLIDIGGESTRPGSLPVEEGEQVRRVAPVIEGIARAGVDVTVSIDTTRAAVAEAALAAGAHLVNDISGGRDDERMLPLVARAGVPVVLMHMKGTPRTMQDRPEYSDVVGEVKQFLRERAEAAVAAGVERGKILLDPGIGFGKGMGHNLELLRRTREFAEPGYPLLVGTSRKGFIGKITGEAEPERRVFGTAASVAYVVANGADIVRVHDVGAMVQVVRMVEAIVGEG